MKSRIEPRHPDFYFARGRLVMVAFGDSPAERAGAGVFASADNPFTSARIAEAMNALERAERQRLAPTSVAEGLG